MDVPVVVPPYVEYQVTTEDWVACYQYMYTHSEYLRQTMQRARMRWLWWYVCLAALFAVAVRSWFVLPVAAGLIGIWFMNYPRDFRSRWAGGIERMLATSGISAHGPQRLEVLATGIRLVCDLTDSTIKWKRIARVDQTDEDLFILLTGNCPMVVPRAGVIAGDYAGVAAALQGAGRADILG